LLFISIKLVISRDNEQANEIVGSRICVPNETWFRLINLCVYTPITIRFGAEEDIVYPSCSYILPNLTLIGVLPVLLQLGVDAGSSILVFKKRLLRLIAFASFVSDKI